MNKSKIISLVEKYNGHLYNLDESVEISGLTTNLQFADTEMLAIYKLSDDKSEIVFLERLREANPGLILINKDLKEKVSNPYIVMGDSDSKKFVNELIEDLYPINSDLKIFGITGTNGKSTCVSLCEQVVSQLKKRGASLGTIGLTINGKEKDLNITGTTPSYVDLRRIIFLIQDEIDYLFMEVSSHAIIQKRLGKIKLSGAGWTSFSQDHLDYHGSMEEYFSAKAQILHLLKDESGKIVFPSTQKELIEQYEEYLRKENISGQAVVSSRLEELGYDNQPPFFKIHYNKENLELSLELLKEEIGNSKIDINKLTPPKGRFSIENIGSSFAVIDYAHTPDAIENLVKATEMAFPNSRIFTLFGCGGDRDKTKRPLMASAAEKYGSGVIVTTDNPRSEEPEDIIKDILSGLSSKPLLVDADRENAIREGIKLLNKNDVLIIAGKGHEEYQEIKGKKIFYSDFDVLKKIRDELND